MSRVLPPEVERMMAERKWTDDHDYALKTGFILNISEKGKVNWKRVALFVNSRCAEIARTAGSCYKRYKRLVKYHQWTKLNPAGYQRAEAAPSAHVLLRDVLPVSPPIVPEATGKVTQIRSDRNTMQLWSGDCIGLSVRICDELKENKEVMDACWAFLDEVRRLKELR